jgi:hypothetical protein
MKRNKTMVSDNKSWSLDSLAVNFSQQEKMRHCKLASVTIPICMLFLLTLVPQALIDNNLALVMVLAIGLGVCIFALLLNWRGLVSIAGILTLIAVYTAETFTLFHYPGGLKVGDLYILDLTIIPLVIVLSFFSANSIFPVFCVNTVQIWAVLVYGRHDSAIAQMLHNTPFQPFLHAYVLQLIVAVILYILARGTEQALARSHRAKDIAAYEKREQERQMHELEKRRQLDDGIQQILQTHVAVANGDLNARTPLHKDHDLWQVAGTLNNLIARLQSQHQTIQELKQQIQVENKRTVRSLANTRKIADPYAEGERVTDQHARLEQGTGQYLRLERATSQHPRVEQGTSQYPKLERTTGQQPKLEQATGEHAKLEQATNKYPKLERN